MSHLPVPDINKRQRDDATEALIREALEEEQQRKKAKKGDVAGGAEGCAVFIKSMVLVVFCSEPRS